MSVAARCALIDVAHQFFLFYLFFFFFFLFSGRLRGLPDARARARASFLLLSLNFLVLPCSELAVSGEEALQIIQELKYPASPGSSSSSSSTPLSASSWSSSSSSSSSAGGAAALAAARTSSSLTPSTPSSLPSSLSSWPPSAPSGESALQLLERESASRSVVTMCRQLDELLGGGVPLGRLTEFCGAPGLGKTQLSIQLAVDVGIPTALGGVGGECIYIDTEGSFVVDRAVDIAAALLAHLQAGPFASEQESLAAQSISVQSLLGGVHLVRAHDYIEQLAVVHSLPQLIADRPAVRLIVLDSVAFHFRQDFDDYALRLRLLSQMAQTLTAVAGQQQAAVVLINQVTTKMSGGGGGGTGTGSSTSSTVGNERTWYVPALGDSWGHACTNRVMLHWSGRRRLATLTKSSYLPTGSAAWQVLQDGVRDCADESDDDG